MPYPRTLFQSLWSHHIQTRKPEISTLFEHHDNRLRRVRKPQSQLSGILSQAIEDIQSTVCEINGDPIPITGRFGDRVGFASYH
ncbi:hypothetical protein [uncultured Bradyrhizobium sp.]|uniref:hypothetical protein n=1 Tax=uncultured Bradyrhizobium sp. TaxID=199684 RepID=UPI0026381A82|nr:hypothetical protein [uncultured Bradyrhizobium sp.]